jgi:chlorophyllase
MSAEVQMSRSWVWMVALLVACGDEDKGSAPVTRADMGADMVATQDMPIAADMAQPDQAAPPDMDASDMMEAPDQPAEDQGGPQAPYVGSGDVYQPGALDVRVATLAEGMSGAPVATQVFAPQAPGGYPLVVFQHGFLLSPARYSALLEHIASHGFVVVAPQMYAADGNPIGKPSTTEEAALAATVRTWAVQSVGGVIGYTPRVEALALVGHSRGGKVVWRELVALPTAAQAVVGIDPVDGEGGPLGGDTRVVDGAFTYTIPSLVIGSGLGTQPLNAFAPACAPMGDNHVQFYGAAPAPAWHATVTDYGHLDMLNDDTSGCGLTCSSCKAGETKAPMRRTSAGLTVAFLRAALQGDMSAYTLLSEPQRAPASFAQERR